jgi:Mrp family chromosome partitioning ATPase
VPLVASVFYNGLGSDKPRTCMLTSVSRGSGVTTTALGLSMVLAASTAESVALVNANPVSPGLDAVLDLDGMTTFADLLRGRTDAPLMTNRNVAHRIQQESQRQSADSAGQPISSTSGGPGGSGLTGAFAHSITLTLVIRSASSAWLIRAFSRRD